MSNCGPGHQPRGMNLNVTRATLADLWEGDHDIVVASYAPGMHKHRRVCRFIRFIHIWNQCGKGQALEVAEEERLPTSRPTAPLFTALLYLLPLRIPSKTA
jgi:hypothetical protein